MSKFCPKCGASLEDDAKFCSSCGAEVAAEEVPVQENVESPVTEEAGLAKRTVSFQIPDFKALISKIDRPTAVKWGGIAAGVVAAIIAIIVAISLIFPSPEAVVKKAINGYIKGDAKAVVSVVPPFFFEDKDDKKDAIEALEETLEDGDYEDIKYQIKKVSDMSSSDKKIIKGLLEYYEEYADDFDVDDVTGFKTVKVRIEDGDETVTKEMSVIKYKGRWYLFDGSLGL